MVKKKFLDLQKRKHSFQCPIKIFELGRHLMVFTQNQPKVGKAPNAPQNTKQDIIWSPPPISYLKVNTDASFSYASKQAYLGAVCRDYNATWVEGFQPSTFTQSTFEAEVKAILLLCIG